MLNVILRIYCVVVVWWKAEKSKLPESGILLDAYIMDLGDSSPAQTTVFDFSKIGVKCNVAGLTTQPTPTPSAALK